MRKKNWPFNYSRPMILDDLYEPTDPLKFEEAVKMLEDYYKNFPGVAVIKTQYSTIDLYKKYTIPNDALENSYDR